MNPSFLEAPEGHGPRRKSPAGYPWHLQSPLTLGVPAGPGALTSTMGLGTGSGFFGYKGQCLCLELVTVDTQDLALPDRSIGR